MSKDTRPIPFPFILEFNSVEKPENQTPGNQNTRNEGGRRGGLYAIWDYLSELKWIPLLSSCPIVLGLPIANTKNTTFFFTAVSDPGRTLENFIAIYCLSSSFM